MSARIDALHEYIDTLNQIRNEGHIDDLDMRNWAKECGTVFCVAGWKIFNDGQELSERAFEAAAILWSDSVIQAVYSDEVPRKLLNNEFSWARGHRAWELLFGPDNCSGLFAWERQMRRAQWMLEREQKREAFESIPDLPKAERNAVYERWAA